MSNDTLRTAAQMALDALQRCTKYTSEDYAAMDALTAALAQEQQPKQSLPFSLEQRAGVWVLAWHDHGCRPASEAEVQMWQALAQEQTNPSRPIAKLLAESEANFVRNFGRSADAEWIYADLLDLLCPEPGEQQEQGEVVVTRNEAGAIVAVTRQDGRDDGMPASKDERHLRRLLAARVGIRHLYCDDGEASGTEHGISFDFMRDSVNDLDVKLVRLGMARYQQKLAAQEQPAPQVHDKADLKRLVSRVFGDEFEIVRRKEQAAQEPKPDAGVRRAVEKLGTLRSFLLGWRDSAPCKRNEMEQTCGQWIDGLSDLFRWYSDAPIEQAAQEPRKPMTQADMRKLTMEHFGCDLTGSDYTLIRAVERFHKIGDADGMREAGK